MSHLALLEAVEDKSKLLEVDKTRAPVVVATSDQALTQLRSERAEETAGGRQGDRHWAPESTGT